MENNNKMKAETFSASGDFVFMKYLGTQEVKHQVSAGLPAAGHGLYPTMRRLGSLRGELWSCRACHLPCCGPQASTE